MGMYSRIELQVTVASGTPDVVKSALRWLAKVKGMRDDTGVCPYQDDNGFWSLPRHHQIGENYGWDNAPAPFSDVVDLEGGRLSVTMRSHYKDYDGQIKSFLLWLWPFVEEEPGTVVGLYTTETDGVTPSRMYDVHVGGDPRTFKKSAEDDDDFMAGM